MMNTSATDYAQERMDDEEDDEITATPNSVAEYIERFLSRREDEDRMSWSQHRRAAIRVPVRACWAVTQTYLLLGSHSFLNLLIPVIPFAFVTGRIWSGTALSFVLNYVALLCLAGLFRYGCEITSASLPAGRAAKLLWNAIFGMWTLDLEVAVLAVFKGELRLAQNYSLGRVIASCLLTTGVCHITSGLRRGETTFNPNISRNTTALLFAAGLPLWILTVCPASWSPIFDREKLDETMRNLSKVASALMLLLYMLYLLFTHVSHWRLLEPVDADSNTQQFNRRPPVRSAGKHLSLTIALCAPVLTFFCGGYLLSAMREIGNSTAQNLRSPAFVGICLIPLLGEAAELPHISWLSWVDRADFAFGLADKTAIQAGLLVSPGIFFLAALTGQPLTLAVSGFSAMVHFLSVWIFSLLFTSGRSDWLRGATCLLLYFIICLNLLAYPWNELEKLARN